MRTWVEMDEWEHAVSFRNPIKRPLWKDRGGENHSFVATPRHSNPPFPSLLTAIYVSHSIGHGSRNFQINTLLNHGTVGCLSSRRTRDHGRNSSCSPIGYWGLHGERGSSGGISYVSKASCYFFFAIDANSFDPEVWVLNTKASCPSISENPRGWNDGWRIFPRGAKPSNRLGEHSDKCKPLSWKKKMDERLLDGLSQGSQPCQ